MEISKCERRTKVMKRGLLMKFSWPQGGMNLGLPCSEANFGTGRRLRIPKRAIPEQSEVPRAHTLSVQRRPTFSRRAFKMNGKTNPGGDFVRH